MKRERHGREIRLIRGGMHTFTPALGGLQRPSPMPGIISLAFRFIPASCYNLSARTKLKQRRQGRWKSNIPLNAANVKNLLTRLLNPMEAARPQNVRTAEWRLTSLTPKRSYPALRQPLVNLEDSLRSSLSFEYSFLIAISFFLIASNCLWTFLTDASDSCTYITVVFFDIHPPYEL